MADVEGRTPDNESVGIVAAALIAEVYFSTDPAACVRSARPKSDTDPLSGDLVARCHHPMRPRQLPTCRIL